MVGKMEFLLVHFAVAPKVDYLVEQKEEKKAVHWVN